MFLILAANVLVLAVYRGLRESFNYIMLSGALHRSGEAHNSPNNKRATEAYVKGVLLNLSSVAVAILVALIVVRLYLSPPAF